jgi:hypothetical protein
MDAPAQGGSVAARLPSLPAPVPDEAAPAAAAPAPARVTAPADAPAPPAHSPLPSLPPALGAAPVSCSWPLPIDEDVGEIFRNPRTVVKSTDYRWEMPALRVGRPTPDNFHWLITEHTDFPDVWPDFVGAFLDAQSTPLCWVSAGIGVLACYR